VRATQPTAMRYVWASPISRPYTAHAVRQRQNWKSLNRRALAGRRLCLLPLQKLVKKRGSVFGGEVADMVLAEETVEQF
jgi:hypothetical protein